MKRYLIFILLFFFSYVQAYSNEVDFFNTYRWNRKNYDVGNGRIDRGPWFEWWYYKVVLPQTNEAFFFVYGVVNPWDQAMTMESSRSYVGMGDFNSKKVFDRAFPLTEFSAAYERTEIFVADNIATDRYFSGMLSSDQGETVSWNINIEKKWAFNATGWATGRMITDIEWYPAQADARCSGEITSGGKVYAFDNVPCYQDRNWGKEFPEWWAWIVSNQFEGHPDTTLAIGGGKPKVRGRYTPIEGVAIGLKHKGEEYSFRPNDLDKVTFNINYGTWEVMAINGSTKIEIKAWAPKERFMDLQFMTPQGRVFHDYEALVGQVEVKLYKKFFFSPKWKLVETLHSRHAGIEYGSFDSFDFHHFWHGKKALFESR